MGFLADGETKTVCISDSKAIDIVSEIPASSKRDMCK
jgi:hypothetical protein